MSKPKYEPVDNEEYTEIMRKLLDDDSDDEYYDESCDEDVEEETDYECYEKENPR